MKRFKNMQKIMNIIKENNLIVNNLCSFKIMSSKKKQEQQFSLNSPVITVGKQVSEKKIVRFRS